MRVTGTVKFFNGAKGYGFITPADGGKDVFVHATALEAAGIRTLNEGDKVTFVLEDDRKGRGKQAGQIGRRPAYATIGCAERALRGPFLFVGCNPRPSVHQRHPRAGGDPGHLAPQVALEFVRHQWRRCGAADSVPLLLGALGSRLRGNDAS